jgi:putative acetyltransferase
MITMRHACFPEDTAAVLDIWREYIASPSVSLDYQDYEAEFADLPGKYAPPGGRLLLGEVAGRIEGSIALPEVSDTVCEMKRLYVRPGARGHGLGAELVRRLIAEARKAGHAEMRLDVLAEFEAARRPYAELGFVPADPVSINPIPGASFLGLRLR